jgi:SAM-dependent methyltransferase
MGRVPLPSPEDPYDRLPYTDHAYAETHPDRLAVVAMFSGWEPGPVESARILELGCGRGGNLLPMAAGLPQAELVGVDRSRRQIEEARSIAAATGLENTRFVEASFETLDGAGAPFDYVIAHGVASWVPPHARRSLLLAVAKALTPGGVAYLSFNVLPGWYDRMAARDWLRWGGGDHARASLAWLRNHVSPENADYRRRLDAVAARLDETEQAYLTHEYLTDDHHPLLVATLLAEASESGLAYLGDAIPGETALELLDDEVRDRARGMDAPGALQLVDFVRNTAFRRSLFVRADQGAARAWRWSPELKEGALERLRLASRLRPHTHPSSGLTERFDAGEVSVQVADGVTRHALHELTRIAPRSLPFSELAGRIGASDQLALQKELFDLWLATGALELHTREPAIAVIPGDCPLACPVARWHALHGGAVTNRWHHEVRLADPVLRRVLALLDGRRTIDDVARAAGCAVDTVRVSVAALAAAALLLA